MGHTSTLGKQSDLIQRLTELRADMRHNADEVATLDLAISALSTQGEPSDAQVEGGCVAFYEGAQGITSWARLAETDPQLANRYRDGIRAALRAAVTCTTMSDPQRRVGE